MLDAHTLQILTESAKYDVSCSSSGSKRANRAGGLGNASVGGICHSFTPDGRCISLLKILMSNECLYDCDLTGDIALVVGGEDAGVSRLTREKCDKILSLPLKGKVNSLNASVALGIAAYEAVRQRK